MIQVIRRLLVNPTMQDRSTAFSSEQVAQRWRDLAERRRCHFIDLYESGRWKHYYTEADFVIRLREVFQAAEQWEKLASPQPAAPAPTSSFST
jgi:uncharacterized repeat protein (TIGR03809 family)